MKITSYRDFPFQTNDLENNLIIDNHTKVDEGL